MSQALTWGRSCSWMKYNDDDDDDNEQRSFSKLSIISPPSQLILQPFHYFTYITAHSPTLPLLHLCYSLFSNPSFASAISQALQSTTVGQMVACVPVMQWARVWSPVRISFLGEVFRGFSSPVRQMSWSFRPPRSPNIIWPSLSLSLILHYGRQWPEMLTRPKTSNIHTYNIC